MTFLGLGVVELIMLGVWIFAMIDVLVTPAEQVRNLPKGLWFLIVLLILPGLWIIGAVLWFSFGRPRASVPAGPATPARGPSGGRAGPSGPRRSVAPDDDIEFLRGLNRKPGDPA